MGAKQSDLVDTCVKQIRSVLELAVPAWHSGINQTEKIDIERIQKSAAHIILGEEFESYRQAIKTLGLDSLVDRREKLCLKFALKAEKHNKFVKWFKPAVYPQNTRQDKVKYCSVLAMHSRFRKSPLPFLTDRLNMYYNKK